MLGDDPVTVKDGAKTIIYSETFNLYEDTLTLEKIAGFTFEFKFIDDQTKPSQFEISPDNTSKTIKVLLTNWRNTFGVGTPKPVAVINMKDGSQVLFSFMAKALGQDSKFIHFTVSFYY